VHIIRQQLTEDTDGAPSSDTNAENLDDVASAGEDAQTEDTDEAMEQIRLRSLNGPSEEAREKFKDYRESLSTCVDVRTHETTVIPYGTYEQADSATKNPQLKLLFRLLNFTVVDEGDVIYGPQVKHELTAA
jgi:replication fork protection complex subunit Tof1/Swi1